MRAKLENSVLQYPHHEIVSVPVHDGYQRIEDYGIVGDLHTTALIGRDGSVDFMCFPNFDSPSIFAAMIDKNIGGRFQICPLLNEARQKKMYLPETNVLISRFLADEGVAEISNFMPITEFTKSSALVRRVKTIRGEVKFRLIFDPRFDYARGEHTVEKRISEVLFHHNGPTPLTIRLISPVDVRIENGAAIAEFTLRAGETATFVMEHAVPGIESPYLNQSYLSDAFKETVNYWRRWIRRSTYRGRWREAVDRSALTLKLLTSKKYGSIVAAPTFGLPSELGGERNWDYRYTWLRDASFTIYALLRLGFTEEAGAFMKWLEDRCTEIDHGSGLQIMYGIDGKKNLFEEMLPHLEGYRKSSPVRIGNGAYNQIQLDIYGELMDAVYLYDKHCSPISHDLWRHVVILIDWLCSNWKKPDSGIWEVRGGLHEFLFSRTMSWVALDRAIRLSQKRSLPAPLSAWVKTRDKIYADIFKNFWNKEKNTFVQRKNSSAVDAANLIMPLVRFISPTDPRFLSTLQVIEQELLEDSLVFRYKGEQAAYDGLSGQDGTFSLCTFWYVECLSRSGDLQKARLVFEKMLGYANELGLYSEQLGACGDFLGNFPQAFTHLGLISAAFDLDRRLSLAE